MMTHLSGNYPHREDQPDIKIIFVQIL